MTRGSVLAAVVALSCAGYAQTELRAPHTVRAGDGPVVSDYWSSWLAHPKCYRAYSMRPVSSQTIPAHTAGCSAPNYGKQLLRTADGGYASGGQILWWTYDVASDTHPEKQDGAKLTVPAFSTLNSATLATAVSPTETVLSLASNVPTNAHAIGWIVDAEIMTCVHPDQARWCAGGNLKNDPTNASGLCNPAAPYSCSPDYGSRQMYVARAQFASLAASHSAGAGLRRTRNSPNDNRLNFPIDTQDGHTYFIVQDLFFTSSWLYSGLTSYKMVQARMGHDGRLWESRMRWEGGANCSDAPNFNPAVHVAAVDVRSYNTLGGPADWSMSTGEQLGPSSAWTRNDPLCPMAGNRTYVVPASRWLRWYWFIDQRESDYDRMTMWVVLEGGAPVMLFDQSWISVYPDESNAIKHWQQEFDTSTDAHVRGLVGGTPDGMRDFVIYGRNLGVLRDVTLAEATALVAAPVP